MSYSNMMSPSKVFGKRYKTPFELLCELPMFAVLREDCKNDET